MHATAWRRFREPLEQDRQFGPLRTSAENPRDEMRRSGGEASTDTWVGTVHAGGDGPGLSAHPAVSIGGEVNTDGQAAADRNSGKAVKQAEAAELWDEPEELHTRPGAEVADVFRVFGPEYRWQVGSALSVQQDRVLRELMACRTEAMGKHVWGCDACGSEVELFMSCNNRHCPKCQAKKRREWAERMQKRLLPVDYWHVIYAVPSDVTRCSCVPEPGP